jgi:predicted  nucleic acid-binding Zn-ribbon protein
MDANEKNLTQFATRVRQVIFQYQTVQKQNADLNSQIEALEVRIKELESQLQQAHIDYESLKMAKMIEISDGELDSAKKRLSKLIRDVNKCITLLSE